MSIITANLTNKYYFKYPFFDLLINTKIKSTNIAISFFGKDITTEKLPQTLLILKHKLPSILRSKCFNEYNFPFNKEVKNTELGHLFEHILLEYICKVKRDMGIPRPLHNGVTKWNWYKEKRGLFHITIDVGIVDKDILQVALQNTAKLTEDILISRINTERPVQFPYISAVKQLS